MWINYRKPEDAVADTSRRNRYGYFASLRSSHPKHIQEELVVETFLMSSKPWPLQVLVSVTIHNHEDLQHFVDGAIQVYDETRGEFGENEKTSPSEFKLIR